MEAKQPQAVLVSLVVTRAATGERISLPVQRAKEAKEHTEPMKKEH
ncbi:MAG: hypothetical protein ACRDF8_07260 [Chloroflexota bacterium]